MSAFRFLFLCIMRHNEGKFDRKLLSSRTGCWKTYFKPTVFGLKQLVISLVCVYGLAGAEGGNSRVFSEQSVV